MPMTPGLAAGIRQLPTDEEPVAVNDDIIVEVEEDGPSYEKDENGKFWPAGQGAPDWDNATPICSSVQCAVGGTVWSLGFGQCSQQGSTFPWLIFTLPKVGDCSPIGSFTESSAPQGWEGLVTISVAWA